MPRTGGGITTMTRPSWMEAKRWNRVALDGGGGFLRIARPLLERLEGKEHRPGVRSVGEGRAGEAGEVDRVRDARHLQGDVHDLLVDRIGARERGAARQLRHDDQIACNRAAG